MTTFESLNLDEHLLKATKKLGFKNPTKIQEDSIPLILNNRDVIGESATGSGKTLAFSAGIANKCVPKKGVQAVVLVPTRELAEQVKDEIITLTNRKLSILAIYGGVSINPQINQLPKAEVVIATPGRMLDHIERRTINLTKVKILILDEADRMVEMGFIDDVEKIIKQCPKERQTLLFSATMYGPAKAIAKKHMQNPETVTATKMVDPTKLKQTYYDVPGKLKIELLLHLLKQEGSYLVMVFCNTRNAADLVVETLKANKIKAAAIHGGLNQSKRLNTIDMFHKDKFHVLVCTDVAARGLHIEGVTHIYNYDIPNEPSDYVHRIGRTARAGKEGLVINLISQRDYDNFSKVINTHRDYNIEKIERPFLEANPKNTLLMSRSRSSSSSRGGPRGSSRGRPRGNNSSREHPRSSSSSRGGPRRNSSPRSNRPRTPRN